MRSLTTIRLHTATPLVVPASVSKVADLTQNGPHLP